MAGKVMRSGRRKKQVESTESVYITQENCPNCFHIEDQREIECTADYRRFAGEIAGFRYDRLEVHRMRCGRCGQFYLRRRFTAPDATKGLF